MHVALPDYTFYYQLLINKNMLLLDLSFHQRGGVSSFSWIGRVFSDICRPRCHYVIFTHLPTIGNFPPYPMKNSITKKYCTQCIINNNLLSCIGFFGFHLIGLHPGEGGNVDWAFSEVFLKKAKRFERNGSNAHLHYRESHRLKVALLPDI